MYSTVIVHRQRFDPIIFCFRKLTGAAELSCATCTAHAKATWSKFNVQFGVPGDAVMKFACLHVRVACKEVRQLLC